MKFLEMLFSSGQYMPHGYCYLWLPGLVWLHVISDSLIALAYLLIPITLVDFIRKRRDLPFNWMFVCFGVFILSCGATHVMEVWTLWHATYWLSGAVKAVTALSSVPTAILLIKLVPQAVALPSPEVLRVEVAERRRAEHALREAKGGLELRVAERTAELQGSNRELMAEVAQRKTAEAESTSLRDELAAELKAMTRLHEFSARLLAATDLQPLLNETLNATIALQNADFGNVQLLNPETQALEIVAQRGFKQDFLDHFSSVCEAGAACGRAMQRERVIIEDVLTDQDFERHRPIAASAAFRAVQSTPLFGRGGQLFGMISTHFRKPHRPSEHDLRLTDLYADQAAQMIERKRSEESLQAAQAQLAHMGRVSTMGELTASIAHEINQPLAAVVTNGEACLRWLAAVPARPEKARESVARMIEEGNRASEIVNRIRALSKRAPLQKAMLQANDVVRDVVGLVGAELRRSHVSLKTELASVLPPLWGDRVQLHQVILNLMMNGIEAMSAVTGRPRELSVSSRRAASGEVLIGVRDSGPGLDPRFMDRVFEAFFTTKREGIGMGLSISRRIVEAHGGRLWCSASGAEGATFEFILPVAAGAAA